MLDMSQITGGEGAKRQSSRCKTRVFQRELEQAKASVEVGFL